MSKKYKKDLKESRYKELINSKNILLMLLYEDPVKQALLALIEEDKTEEVLKELIKKKNYYVALLVTIALKNYCLFEKVLEEMKNYIKSDKINPLDEEFIMYVIERINNHKKKIKKDVLL